MYYDSNSEPTQPIAQESDSSPQTMPTSENLGRWWGPAIPPPPPPPPRRRTAQAAIAVLVVVLAAIAGLAFFVIRHGFGRSVGIIIATATVTLAPTALPTTPVLVTAVPTPSATASAVVTVTPTLVAKVDNYIAHLSIQQQVGELLMVAVYANQYTADLHQAMTQWKIGNAIIFTNYNGGPTEPATSGGLRQLTDALQSDAGGSLLIATDEEGGSVDRLAPYNGPSPSPSALAATGNPQNAYNQAAVDAQRLKDAGINVDFAPLADVYQGGGIDPTRTFGTNVGVVTTYAGEFLDGLQQNGVAGTLKHWPGIGAAAINPDYGLPTINASQQQMNAIDFAPFRNLLPRHPDLIMVTHVIVRAYDALAPASLSPILVQQVLRGQLGYGGVVVTDAMVATAIQQYMAGQGYSNPTEGIAEASIRAILAGDDIVECPIAQDQLSAVVQAMTQAVQSGRITPDRLQESLQRIILLKVQLGLIVLP